MQLWTIEYAKNIGKHVYKYIERKQEYKKCVLWAKTEISPSVCKINMCVHPNVIRMVHTITPSPDFQNNASEKIFI